MPVPKFFEDQSPEVQAAQRHRRKAEIEAVGRMKFPVQAVFGLESVSVLGPVARFSPYKEQMRGAEDPSQLMVQRADGTRFITFASGLRLGGVPMVTPLLPLRMRRDPFSTAIVMTSGATRAAFPHPQRTDSPAPNPQKRIAPRMSA